MKKYIAEFIGTFSLVLFGCGLQLWPVFHQLGRQVSAYLVFPCLWIAVVVMAYAIGPISGCHINPAITVSMLVAGKIKTGDAIGYIIAQLCRRCCCSWRIISYSKRNAWICFG